MIITNECLQRILVNVITAPAHYYPITQVALQDLYSTGCRSKEILQIERWKKFGKEYHLRTFKTEKVRVFQGVMLSEELKACIEYQIPPYNGLTYNQIAIEFRRSIELHPIMAGKRVADTYLFRYNRARQMFQDTNNISAVMNFFGWQSINIATNYIVRPLTYNP